MNIIDDFIYDDTSDFGLGNRDVSHLLSRTFAAITFAPFVSAPNGDRLNQYHFLIGRSGVGKGVSKNALRNILDELGDCRPQGIGSFGGCHRMCVERDRGYITDFASEKLKQRILPVLFTEGGYFEAEIIKSKNRFDDIRRPLLSVLDEIYPHQLKPEMLRYCSWVVIDRDGDGELKKVIDRDLVEITESIKVKYGDIWKNMASISDHYEDRPMRMLWGKGSIEMYKAVKERLSKEKHPVFEGALSKVFKLACLSDILDQWPAKELSLMGETMEKECLWFMKQAKKVQRFL